MTKLRFFFPLIGAGCLLFILASCGDQGSRAPTGSGGEKKKRFAFVTNGVADFWTIAEAGAKAAADQLGVEATVLMPAGGLTDQKQMLEDLMNRGVDGIAVSPIDPANQTDILNQVAKVTTLITHDSDAPESNRIVYIGMDNYAAGRMCGKLVKEALPTGGEVMILIGRMEQDNSKRRRQGVIDELMDRSFDPGRFDPPGKAIEGRKYTVLGTLTDQFDRSKAKANAEDTISRYPEVNAIVGLFAYNPPAILQALEQAGKLNQIKVIGFDEDSETLAGIQSGSVYGTVVQNPYQYGYQSMKILNAIVNGDMSLIPENRFMNIPARQIRKNNVDEFWSDLKKKMGK